MSECMWVCLCVCVVYSVVARRSDAVRSIQSVWTQLRHQSPMSRIRESIASASHMTDTIAMPRHAATHTGRSMINRLTHSLTDGHTTFSHRQTKHK
mmetsp:Transcript_27581/g.79361  ORF Transcript_27581/g.79361 Transcript_27581/m.79361 type:complete len:96 (+) Transcript_27581:99-386(+)